MTQALRVSSFGQAYQPTFVDRFGVWLSRRQILRWLPKLEGARIGDFGCGYHAAVSRTFLPQARELTLIDVALSNELKANSKVRCLEGDLNARLGELESESLDYALCVSVLEHLWEPETALKHIERVLRPGGTCLLNVPSWRGKFFLEYSAFKLGLSPKDEMDDHKMYYDPRDFWPLLVRAGFLPSGIRCFTHKFGLNTFAVCQKGSRV